MRKWQRGLFAAMTCAVLLNEFEPVRASEPAAIEAVGLTLADVERFTLDNHPALNEAGAEIEVARGKAVQAGLYPNPVWYASSPQWAGNISQYNTYVGQDFVTGGKLKLDQLAAHRSAWQSEWQAVQTRQDVLKGVRWAFFSAVVAEQRLSVYQQMLVIAEKSSDLGADLMKAGEISQADVLALETETQLAQTNVENAEVQLVASQRKLAAATGVPHWRVGLLRANLKDELPEYDEDNLRAIVLADHSLSQKSRIEIDRAGVLHTRACREVIPNFNVQGGYQRTNDPSISPGLRDQGYFQLAVTVPLWDRNQGNIHAAENDIARASASLKRVEAELSDQVADAVARYRSAVKLVKRYESDVLPRARRVLTLNQQLFKQGQTDFLRLYQAQRSLSESELKYLDAQEQRWQAAAAIANLQRQEQFP